MHTGLAHHVLCRTRPLWWYGQMKHSCHLLGYEIALIAVAIGEVCPCDE